MTHCPAEATGTLKWWLDGGCGVGLVRCLRRVFAQKHAGLGRPFGLLRWHRSSRPSGFRSAKYGRAISMRSQAGASTCRRKVDGLGQDEPVWCRWHTAARVQEAELEFDEAGTCVSPVRSNLDHAAMGKVAYYIEAGDAKSGPFWLSVENVPVVALQSVRYEPPGLHRRGRSHQQQRRHHRD